ncbi:inositol monophosphatase family protein [Fredinandcohnia quinoae]|uniref:inositol-phosphate phosphatase n=1 Tax=Fredinandcohnia quinoae TaxID=2918902 RepID=A0AAW5E577_9BACI|nr:inositol monophosphatase family protein [Fredinandcohnia sp. SECRCQ15]MCH1623934.1 inositol monophosphatase family protein [Fredinandcohnia sp. SECRCQ15]
MLQWDEIDHCAKQWIKDAGERIRQSFQSKLTIESKSNPDDLVTNMDKEIEQFFINNINKTFPTHKILGEEGFGNNIDTLNGVVWIIDPIDGTMNFVHQQRNFAISIGIYENGVGKIGLIYDVVHDELYHARKGKGAFLNTKKIQPLKNIQLNESILGINATWITENKRIDPRVLIPLVNAVRGTRSYGSAALEIAYVVTGRIDTYITMRLSPWDFAGGIILLEEVGGVATTLEGKPLNLLAENSVIVTKKNLHTEIFEKYLN